MTRTGSSAIAATPVAGDIRVTALEAETRLPALLELVAQGRTVTILRQGRPVARLAPAGPAPEQAACPRVAATRAPLA